MKRKVNEYFDGYKQVLVPRADGKGMRREYRYVGDWYSLKSEAIRLARLKVYMTILFVVFAVLFFVGAFLNTGASHGIYTGPTSLLMLVPLIYWADGIWNLLTAQEKMPKRKFIYGYRRMDHSMRGMRIMAFLQGIGEVLYLIICHKDVEVLWRELLFLGIVIAEIVLLFVGISLQKKVRVEVTDQEGNRISEGTLQEMDTKEARQEMDTKEASRE